MVVVCVVRPSCRQRELLRPRLAAPKVKIVGERLVLVSSSAPPCSAANLENATPSPWASASPRADEWEPPSHSRRPASPGTMPSPKAGRETASNSPVLSELSASSFCLCVPFDYAERATRRLTTQAQRPGPRGRRIATATRWPGSLQRMVRRHRKSSPHRLPLPRLARASMGVGG
jgi:hypothetical protein